MPIMPNNPQPRRNIIKSQTYPNFYETLTEARMRLSNTVILYDSVPYYVIGLASRPDGIFRVYMQPLDCPNGPFYDEPDRDLACPSGFYASGEQDDHGEAMDSWMAKAGSAKYGVIRKMANSPKFNKFRPFPLGMYNSGKRTFYLARTPKRCTLQGLSKGMIYSYHLSLENLMEDETRGSKERVSPPPFFSLEFLWTVLGVYPSAESCIASLRSPEILNKAVGFHRDFAFIRGPAGILYLVYKTSIVGMLPPASHGSDNTLTLLNEYSYLKEVIEEEVPTFKSIEYFG